MSRARIATSPGSSLAVQAEDDAAHLGVEPFVDLAVERRESLTSVGERGERQERNATCGAPVMHETVRELGELMVFGGVCGDRVTNGVQVPFELGPDHLFEQVVAGGVVVLQISEAHTGASGHGSHRERVEPSFDEQVASDADQLGAASLTVSAPGRVHRVMLRELRADRSLT